MILKGLTWKLYAFKLKITIKKYTLSPILIPQMKKLNIEMFEFIEKNYEFYIICGD
jgi:hypothetical protein